MPRTAEAVILKESEIIQLENIKEGAVPATANTILRARILLELNKGLSGKDAADVVGTREATVSDTRKRYINDGIKGILDKHRTGRPVINKASLNISERMDDVIDTLKNDDSVEKITVKAVSEALNDEPESVVRQLLKDKGIIAGRQREWKVPASNDFNEKLVGIVGVYLSSDQQAIVARTRRVKESIAGLEGDAQIVVHDKDIANRLKESAKSDEVHLIAALEMFCKSGMGGARGKPDLFAFLDGITRDIIDDESELHIFLHGKFGAPRNKMIGNLFMHEFADRSSWIEQTCIMLGVFYKNERDRSFSSELHRIISEYYSGNVRKDVFAWRKSCCKQDELSVEKYDDKELPKAECKENCVNSGRVEVIARVYTEDGEVVETAATIDNELLKNGFDASSRAAYLSSYDVLEKSLIKAKDQAIRDVTEKYLDYVGKKNGLGGRN